MAGELKTDMRAALAGFDGQAVSLLSEIAAQMGTRTGFDDALLSLCGDPDPMIQRGASWLVLERCRDGRVLAPDQWASLTRTLPVLSDWMAVLHVLQLLDGQTPPQGEAPVYAQFASRFLDHDRPFLRAWSANALCRLAQSEPSLSPQAEAARAAALNDTAASVRARARKSPDPGSRRRAQA